ncbi:uncharacterized protein I303_107044 [Kwoniella dejecticola CBS 10117]|uniref:Uncharacterized protein n=1 Tax=Kwoniella dejecticola CBS 10117 TaxID=1296121 RepID=A0A1A5ZYL2_9TREE|nr:uncharacterized protein I303_06445 [Kwoniella dejecticola CBS 10117]OBR82888.1 hypothetical protein I303_06445 [Kwoniella dejecticola CBS 10117]
MVDAQRNHLIALPPPNPPSDLIASARFLPLHGIDDSHRGKKLRFVGQVLAFHPPTSLLLLTSFPAISSPHSPSPTILVDISAPLLGQSPSSTDVSASAEAFPRHGHESMVVDGANGRRERAHLVNRESLSLSRGEWVNVVGWLEGDGQRMIRKVKTSSSYAKPLPIILEAIHISNSRPPPSDAMYRGNSPTWDGVRTAGPVEVIIVDDDEEEKDDDVVEVTPRPKR